MATETAGPSGEESSGAESTAYIPPTADFVVLFAVTTAILLGATVVIPP